MGCEAAGRGIEVAGRSVGIKATRRAATVREAVSVYRVRTVELARMGPLDAWYDRIDVTEVLAIANQWRASDLKRDLSVKRVRQRTSLTVLPKLTAVINGARRIMDDPPLIVHEEPVVDDGGKILEAYVQSLAADRRPILERYSVADIARKVVGVGSVGTRCYLMLLMDGDGQSPIFFQLKEANRSVLARHAGPSEFENQGQRVVIGQRLVQAASDIFLGWTTYGGHDYYVRQFRDMKGSVNLDQITPAGFTGYSVICAKTLARARCSIRDAAAISGYLGRGNRFDEAIGEFAADYAGQTERDHETLQKAIASGRIAAVSNR